MTKKDPKKEDKQTKIRTPVTYSMAGELPVAINVFPGSIEGEKAAYITQGKDRAVLLYGTAQQVIDYTMGKEVSLTGANIPQELHGTYKRNVSRKEEEAQKRLQKEATTGARTGKTDYTVTLNGEKITPSSQISGYFVKCTFVKGQDGKPVTKPLDQLVEADEVVRKGNHQIELYAGVDMVVSAIITPGSTTHENHTPSRVYQTIDSKV